jgi:hypothetical protein
MMYAIDKGVPQPSKTKIVRHYPHTALNVGDRIGDAVVIKASKRRKYAVYTVVRYH